MQNLFRNFLLLLIISVYFLSCKNETFPKPKAVLRLDYSKPNYTTVNTKCGFQFDLNKAGQLASNTKKESCTFEIEYPKLEATIFLTYRPVNNDLRKLLTDAQNLTQEHVVKADDIRPTEYVNPITKVYGMSYKVIGNAASPCQFYVTDSIKNFLLGSLYFKTKPNYDSILPAATYLRNDIRILMESLKWNRD